MIADARIEGPEDFVGPEDPEGLENLEGGKAVEDDGVATGENANRQSAQIIALTGQLTQLIQEEIQLLEDRRPRDIESLQAEKARLGQLYAEEFKRLRQNPALLGEKGSPTRLKLRELTTIFHEQLLTLGRILNRLRSVTEGMVHAVGAEVEKQRPRVGNYSQAGQIAPTVAQQPAPLTFHQII